MENMILKQIELEKEMTNNAIARYNTEKEKAKQNGTFSNTQASCALIKAELEHFAGQIQNYLDNYSKGHAVRSTVAASYISLLPADVTAFITLKTVLNTIYRQETIQHYYAAIGNALETEYKMQKYKNHNLRYYGAIQKDLNKRSAKANRKRVIIQGVFNKRLQFHVDAWETTAKMQIGLVLLNMLKESTVFIQIRDVILKKRHIKIVEPTQALEDWFLKADNFFEVMQPFYLPMISPPKPWTGLFEGGYISPYLRRNKLIKAKCSDKKDYYKKLNSSTMPKVYEAINILQATPWQINKKVLNVLETLWGMGVEKAGLPAREDGAIMPFPCPEHPRGAPYKPDEIEKVKDWKLSTYMTHKNNVAMRSSRLMTYMMINLANKFKDYKAIYFPHQMDFRGRLYPIPPLLNPQGEDIAKGLLQFNEGKQVNEDTIKWLEIHGANCFGQDKESYEKRIQWVRGNKKLIQDIASDPVSNLEWADADKPFQFLAFCFEYASYLLDNTNFITHLPVRLDGTCNGLQHYSALLRDEKGAKATNLINSDKPSDIYAIVAETLISKLKTLPDALAQKWLELGINRKLAKRPVMVLPYGGTLLSCRKYIQEYLEDNYSLDFIQKHFNIAQNPNDTLFKASNYLANHLWQAIKDTVHSAITGMDYIKSLARVVNHHQNYIEWISPAGLLIRQEYQDKKKTELKTELFGSIVRTRITKPVNKPNKVKQINGICPNYIHSMDSACLMEYLVKAKEAGINSFTSVHDCYGTLAPDCTSSAKLLREAFVKTYKRPLLDDFEYDLIGNYSLKEDEIPKRPDLGTLDINQVLESKYFFN